MNLKAARARFDRQGYLVLPGFVSEKAVQRRIAAQAAFLDVYLQHFGIAHKAKKTPWKRLESGLIKLEKANLQLFDEVCFRLNRLPGAYSLIAKPGLLKLARYLVGDPDLAVYNHNLIISLPRCPWCLDGWHQDAYSSDDLNLVVNWAFSACGAINGGLRVVPGGHRKGFLPHRIKPEEAHLRLPHQVLKDDPDPAQTLQLQLAPGDVVLMHRHLPHAGGTNTSSGVRLVLAARYTSPRLSLAHRLVSLQS